MVQKGTRKGLAATLDEERAFREDQPEAPPQCEALKCLMLLDNPGCHAWVRFPVAAPIITVLRSISMSWYMHYDEVGFRRCSDCLSFTHRHGHAFAHPISGRRRAYFGFSLKRPLNDMPVLERGIG